MRLSALSSLSLGAGFQLCEKRGRCERRASVPFSLFLSTLSYQLVSPTIHPLDLLPQSHHSYPNSQYSQSSNSPSREVAYSSSTPTAISLTYHLMRLFS